MTTTWKGVYLFFRVGGGIPLLLDTKLRSISPLVVNVSGYHSPAMIDRRFIQCSRSNSRARRVTQTELRGLGEAAAFAAHTVLT